MWFSKHPGRKDKLIAEDARQQGQGRVVQVIRSVLLAITFNQSKMCLEFKKCLLTSSVQPTGGPQFVVVTQIYSQAHLL